MKTKTILLVLLAFIGLSTANAQVGIGTTSPDASAALDVVSSNRGFLPPRMTTAQRDEITSPPEGLTIYNTTVNCLQWYIGIGTGWFDACDGTTTSGACAGEPSEFTFDGLTYKPVESSGKCWLDRNLGATQVATQPRSDFSDDPSYIASQSSSFGDLYQWGRAADGHEDRNSGITSTNATTATSNQGNSWDGLFITENDSPFDWLTPQDDNLWQGVNGTNNPCPAGFRVPSEAEWQAEISLWNNATGAFNSPLKLPVAGSRFLGDGGLLNVGIAGNYWSSAVSGTPARVLNVNSSNAFMFGNSRANGGSVRCLKD